MTAADSPQTLTDDLRALADTLFPHAEWDYLDAEVMAAVVLSSNWLAAHVAEQVRAHLAPLSALADEHDECAALLDAASDEIERSRAGLALHEPVRMYPELRFAPWCGECSQGFTAGGDDPPSQRRVSWPCPTAKAAGMVDPLAATLGSAS